MSNPVHPGEVLRGYLPAGLALSEIAKRLGVTRQALSDRRDVDGHELDGPTRGNQRIRGV